MIDITYINETEFDISGFDKLLTQVFNETMKQEGIDRIYEMSVVFVTSEKIKNINKQYRKVDKVTDVLSFPLVDHIQNDILGDIFICIERMKEQAKNYKHSEKRELCFLACHGLLHLLGYDHQNKKDEEMMNRKQEVILNKLDIKREE